MASRIAQFNDLAGWAMTTLKPEKRRVSILVAVVVGNALLAGTADPIAMKILIDSLARRNLYLFLLIVTLSLVLYTGLRQLGAYIERLTQRTSVGVAERLSIKCLNAFYRLPYEDIERSDTGYFVSRLFDEPLQAAAIVQLLVQLSHAAALFTGAVAVCLWLSWKTSLILAAIVPLIRIAAIRYHSRISDAVIEENESQARVREVFGQAVDSYKTVRIFDIGTVVELQVRLYLRRFVDATIRQVKYSAAFKALSGTLLSYAELSVFVAAGVAVLRGALSIGGLFGFVSAYGRVVSSIETLTSMIPAFATLDAQRQRVDSLLLRRDLEKDTNDQASTEMAAEGISLDRGGNKVLVRCDLRLSIGERLLLHGPNGSGKTSLAHVLCGFLRPQGGHVRLPRLDRISALLTPHCFIPGTVETNLSALLASDADRLRFARLLDEFGLSIKPDADPRELSEGEKRKCQIIMTMMKDADFYIFDEPLANVDDASKKAIMNAIIRDTRNKGLIMIMHDIKEYRGLFDSELDLSFGETDLNDVERLASTEEQVIHG